MIGLVMIAWNPYNSAMHKFIDLTGKKFGMATVVSREPNISNSRRWRIKCDCGNEKVVYGSNLASGQTKSCGCISAAIGRAALLTHGKSKDPRYRTWLSMSRRCYNAKSKDYVYYGGRGIKICQRWRDSLDCFFDDMGPKPSEKHSIERMDNDGDYCPENCCWATQSQQVKNRRRLVKP